jgi:tetratricopeptide (TPR) repeat protein
VVFALVRRSRDGVVVQSWELSKASPGKPGELVYPLAEELAFRLLYYLCRGQLRAGSWFSLQQLTQGLGQIQTWQDGKAALDVLDAATQSLTEVLKLDPGYNLAHFALGVIYATLGDYPAAQDAFRQVIQWSPLDASIQLAARYNLALAFYHEFKDWGYEEATNQLDELENSLKNRKRDTYLDQLMALTFCARALVDVQILKPLQKNVVFDDLDIRETRILSNCEDALNIDDNHPDILAAVHYARGLIHLNHSSPDDPGNIHLTAAIQEFVESVRARPMYTEGWIFLAIARYDNREEKEAIRILERVGELKLPGNQYAMYRLGKIHEALDNPDSAEKAYELAYKVPEAHIALGEMYIKQEKRLPALIEFRSASKLNTKSLDPWQNIAWCIFHPDLLNEELLEEGITAANRFLQLSNNSEKEWEAREILGWGLFIQGKLDRAINELRQSVEVQKNKQNCYHLAAVYFKCGSMEKAREMAIASLQAKEGGGYWHERAVELMRSIEQSKGQSEEKTEPQPDRNE